MEKIGKTIENLGYTERERLDCLHALRQLEQNGGRQTTNDEYLNATMNRVSRNYPGAVEIKRRWGIGREEYRLTDKGYHILDAETSKIKKIQTKLDTLGVQNEGAIDDKLDDTLGSMGTTTGQYFLGKMLLCDGGFDTERSGYFARKQKDLGRDVTAKLKNDRNLRSSANSQNWASSSDTCDNDLLMYYLLFSNNTHPDIPNETYSHKSAETQSSGCGGGIFQNGWESGIESKTTKHTSEASGSWFSGFGSDSSNDTPSSSGCGG